MDTEQFILGIISEAALDSRIPDGIVDLKNVEHVQVIAEVMYDSGINEQTINEFVQRFVDEGKYPERQAYNKEGWLVTFPSKEYRDAALKKHTHFVTDPTHGKGGMNLYYKRKGKQRRQTQQDPSVTEPEEVPTNAPQQPVAGQVPAADAQGDSQQPETPAKNDSGNSNPAPGKTTPDATDGTGEPTESPPTNSSSALPPSGPSGGTSPAGKAPAPEAPATPPTTAPEPAPEPQPITPQYVAISTQFATQKGWKPTPYGEWRDDRGNSMAVLGLSGEVVPINNVHRDELKIYAEKNRT
jgi:hypothetical protein